MSVRADRAPAPVRGGERSPAIYGIRGLAAVALLTVHVAMFSGLLGTKALGTPRPPSNFLGAFFVSGLPSFIGVFFVLPALFLYLPLAKSVIAGTPRPPQRGNLTRRLLRLLPAYYLMYAVVLVTLNRGSIDGVWYVLRPILLLQVYLPSPFVPKLMNGMEITWTVPTMVQWYLVLPLIAWASHKFARRGATPAIRARRLMLPVPILIAIGVAWLFFVKANSWDNRIVFWWPQGFAPSIGVGMWLAIMLALAKVSPQDTPRLLRAAATRPALFWLGALAVYLVNCARPFSVIGMDAIYSVSGLLVTYVMVALFGLMSVLPLIAPGGARPPAVLSLPPIVHLGRVSYGIYLWHFAVMHFFLQPGSILSGDAKPIRELYGTVGFWKLESVTLAGAVLIASLSYALLEKPIAAWGERLLDRRRERVGDAGWRAAVAARLDGGPAPQPSTLPYWPDSIEPACPVLTLDQATVAVASAATDRDAIRSNLIDLERCFGRELLAGATLTGQSRERWARASADLTALWDLFTAYSTVVDHAATALAGTELGRVTNLLEGQAVYLTGAPAPLARRRVTDSGRVRLTVAAAVERMGELFTRTAEVVTAAEAVWNEVTGRLNGVAATLAEVRRHPDGRTDPGLATADAELRRLRDVLATDPLALWDGGQVRTDELDRLRADADALAARTEV